MIKVKWDQTKCTHSGNCVKGLPKVFQVKNGQFVIEVKGASEQEIRDQVAKCPSGALGVENR